MRTLEIPQLLAYIGSRILSQNPQNGAVWTRAQKLGFLNPLGRISDPLEHLFNFYNLVLSGSPRSDAEVFARTKSARADVPNRSDGFFSFSDFLCFDALDLILALVFPLWFFLFFDRSALFSIWSLGPVYVITSCFLQ